MVATRDSRGGSQGPADGGLAGGAAQKDMMGPSWSNRDWRGKGVRYMGDAQEDGGPHGSGRLAGDLGGNGVERHEVGLGRF